MYSHRRQDNLCNGVTFQVARQALCTDHFYEHNNIHVFKLILLAHMQFCYFKKVMRLSMCFQNESFKKEAVVKGMFFYSVGVAP